MGQPIDVNFIEVLWSRHARPTSTGPVVTPSALSAVVSDLRLAKDQNILHQMLRETETPDGLSKEQFYALMASMFGDERTRLQVAFQIFDADGDGHVTPDEIHAILRLFDVEKNDVETLVREVDREGAGSVTFEDFCTLMPEAHPPAVVRYRDEFLRRVSPEPAPKAEPLPHADKAIVSPKHGRERSGEGTSRLQMQIGLFRLLQGAAYRSFRENCAANCETHLRAKTLPYTITNFVAFTDAAIGLYKALDIVDPGCHGVIDAVSRSVHEEFECLQDRITNWEAVDKTPQMETAQRAMAAERRARKETCDVLAAGVELALALRRKNLDLTDVAQGRLAAYELTRQRNVDLHVELTADNEPNKGAPLDYLKSWNHVLLQDADEEVDGAIMPAAYWYEDFMPKLLAACSVSTTEDIAANTNADEAALDHWFETALAAGEFHPFADAVATRFRDCAPLQKLELRQAWRLTRHYLNGVQKRRERLEFGRETGFLSEYVAFLDVYLGRSDVRDAQMRVSFPYFIGPPTWRFLHTAAEIICNRPQSEQTGLVALFKDFFRLFATMYPCPYCRYHLNRFVVRNREVEMYPLEYLILGSHPEQGAFDVSIEDKLATITDGTSLRLFLWKLHNAVSSSITRTEAWYHQEEHASYTTRHWPSLETERMRARALGEEDLSKTEEANLEALHRQVAHLAALRQKMARNDALEDPRPFAELMDKARSATIALEEAIASTGFLEKTYRFDPALADDAPHFTPEEEAFSRSGHFVEV